MDYDGTPLESGGEALSYVELLYYDRLPIRYGLDMSYADTEYLNYGGQTLAYDAVSVTSKMSGVVRFNLVDATFNSAMTYLSA